MHFHLGENTLSKSKLINTNIRHAFVRRDSGYLQVLLANDPQLDSEFLEVICYVDADPGELTKPNSFLKKLINDSSEEDFADDVLSAVNLVNAMENPSECAEEKNQKSDENSAQNTPHTLTPDCARAALGQAICITSTAIENHIDRWLATASDQLLHIKKHAKDSPSQTAAELRDSNIQLVRAFRYRLMQSVHRSNLLQEEQTSAAGNTLSQPENNDSKTTVKLKPLAPSADRKTHPVLNQLNRRFSFLLQRSPTQSKNLFGPEALASCLYAAISDVHLHKDQMDALHGVIKQSFNGVLDNIYREVNLYWMSMNILPQLTLPSNQQTA